MDSNQDNEKDSNATNTADATNATGGDDKPKLAKAAPIEAPEAAKVDNEQKPSKELNVNCKEFYPRSKQSQVNSKDPDNNNNSGLDKRISRSTIGFEVPSGSSKDLGSGYSKDDYCGGGGGVNQLNPVGYGYGFHAQGYQEAFKDYYSELGLQSPKQYSRKVFVGGLPPDIDEDEILKSVWEFGPVEVTWPHKDQTKSYFPPKGFVFLIFKDACLVENFIKSCIVEEGKYYRRVSSTSIKDKMAEVRPWLLSDAQYVSENSAAVIIRQTAFVGGVPRTMKAKTLANIMNSLYGNVTFVGIDTDPLLKYPKGSGRVAFSDRGSFMRALSDRFVNMNHEDSVKRIEVKPFIVENMICDWCMVNKSAHFCGNPLCLKYFCPLCWAFDHGCRNFPFLKSCYKY